MTTTDTTTTHPTVLEGREAYNSAPEGTLIKDSPGYTLESLGDGYWSDPDDIFGVWEAGELSSAREVIRWGPAQ